MADDAVGGHQVLQLPAQGVPLGLERFTEGLGFFPVGRAVGFQLFLLLGPGKIGHLQYGLDIVFHAKFAENRGFLGQVANSHLGPLVHGHGSDLPIGMLTALLGGPFFFWLVRRTRNRGGGWA